ncbi:mediator complex subunit 13 C-terminal-domain-containing protein [Spinellus fusiger]|nr:mediator complex subunit 13 C-terminal-domain-containing protein [Spinellus fusiger]
MIAAAMANVKKRRNYRKRDLEEEEGHTETVTEPTVLEEKKDISDTIEELHELRRLRRKHGGIGVEKLFKGADKNKKKKKPANDDPWKLKMGGLVDKDDLMSGRKEDEEVPEKKLKLDTFTTQTNALDVDKHMMEYIEAEMRKRRGDGSENENENSRPTDIYEELYHLPERLKVEQKRVEEGNVQLSTQMLTAIPEVDLGIDARLKNIEDTERAKRKLMDEQEQDSGKPERKREMQVPANFEKQIRPIETRPRLDRRQMATDEGGVLHIRYRAYTQSCLRASLSTFLKTPTQCPPQQKDLKGELNTNVLIRAYWDLIAMGVPCLWRRAAHNTSRERVVLELWVFWFDDSHTGHIDAHQGLQLLEGFVVGEYHIELNMGSFTWDSLFTKNQSPTASPIARSNISVLVKVGVFLMSQLSRTMIERGAVPMGDYFIDPSLCSVPDVMTPCLTSMPKTEASPLLCSYFDVYLSGTHLVFHSNTAEIHMRSLMPKDMKRGTAVLLAPLGDKAEIVPIDYVLPQHVETALLSQWHDIFHLPLPTLTLDLIPRLVSVRLGRGDPIFYPSQLVFVPTRPFSLFSSSSMADMDSPLSLHCGAANDFGRVWNEWAQTEKLTKGERVNDWALNPDACSAVFSALELLASDSSVPQPSLSMALSEPVRLSHFMAYKTGLKIDTPCNESIDPPEHTPTRNVSTLSLAEFTRMYFTHPSSSPAPVQSVDKEHKEGINLSSELEAKSDSLQEMGRLLDMNTPSETYASDPLYLTPGEQTVINTPCSPHLIQLKSQDPSFAEDSLSTPCAWKEDPLDLDSLSLNVTEADFDFFQAAPTPSSPTTTAAAAATIAPNTPSSVSTLNEPVHVYTLTPDSETDAITLQSLIDHPGSTAHPAPESMQCDTILSTNSDPSNALKITAYSPHTISKQDTSYPSFLGIGLETPRMTFHRSSFMPPEFAPIPLSHCVEEAKYYEHGGKFTYPMLGIKTLKRPLYSPDYVPRPKRRVEQCHGEARPLDPVGLQLMEKDMPLDSDSDSSSGHNNNDSDTNSSGGIGGGSNSNSDSDSDSDSGSGSGSGSESDTKPNHYHTYTTMSDLGNKGATTNTASHKIQAEVTQDKPKHNTVPSSSRWTEGTKKAQVAMLHRWTLDARKYLSLPVHSLSSASLRAGQWYPTPKRKDILVAERDDRALDYLCQQITKGGYPFTSSATMGQQSGGNGERLQGESTAMMCARQRSLCQELCGDITLASCNAGHSTCQLQDFKALLGQLFDTTKTTVAAHTSVRLQPQSSAIRVKGPLTLKHYYEMIETNSVHSKYGKYQVKKRRPVEPSVILKSPTITVGREDDCIEGSSDLLVFWEKMRLEPYAYRKNIQYLVLCPNGTSIETRVDDFFRKELSSVYEACLLGTHRPMIIPGCVGGVVPMDLIEQISPEESYKTRQYLSYMKACLELASVLEHAITEKDHFVIYFVSSVQEDAFYLELCRCFDALKTALGKDRVSLAMQIVPAQHVLLPLFPGGYAKFGLKEIAFSAYTKCDILVENTPYHTLPVFSTHLYTPPFILSKPIPDIIRFVFKKPSSMIPAMLDRGAMMHVAYSFSMNGQWLVVVWTDHRGELLEHSTFKTSDKDFFGVVLEQVWTRTKALAKRTQFTWTFVITRVGLMFESELKAWSSLASLDERLVIISMDLHDPLSLFTPGPFDKTEGDRDVVPSSLIPTPMTPETPSTAKERSSRGEGCTRSIVLNHRVAYSRLNERMAMGKVTRSRISNYEWMLPMASGYMIHDPPEHSSLSMAQDSHLPCTVKLHVLCNQTGSSAYDALRRVIQQYYALSFMNMSSSSSNFLPFHVVLVEKLCRLVLFSVTTPFSSNA